jgi:hypothetical protein
MLNPSLHSSKNHTWNTPDFFLELVRKVERKEITLSPGGYAQFYQWDLVTEPDGIGPARVVASEPGKVTIEKRTKGARRYR